MTPQEEQAQWYVALHEEDCLQVMKLLKAHPGLLMVGWKGESSRQVEGRWPNHFSPPSTSTWKGRTALHVGARRGCVQLVKQVLTLCNLKSVISVYEQREKESSIEPVLIQKNQAELQQELNKYRGNVRLRHIWTQQQRDENTEVKQLVRRETRPSFPPTISKAGDSSLADDRPVYDDSPAQSNPDDIELAQRNSRVSDNSPAQSNPDEIKLAQRVSSTAGPSSENDVPVASEGDQPTYLAQSTVAHWHRTVEERKSLARHAFTLWKKQRTNGQAGDDFKESVEDSEPPLSEISPRDALDFGKSAGGPLERLLVAKDGECGLDALAMAAVNGNHNVLDLLSYTVLECETPPYKVNRKSLLAKNALSPGEIQLRANLRQATEEVIASFPDDPTFDEYSKDRDFNFLPREEYIIHFLYTARFYNRVQRDPRVRFPAALWERARWFSSPVWRFLLTKLQDGQGRTLLHVAVDERTALDLLSDLQMRIDVHLRDRVAVSSAMHARDGAGRTAWHRAVASGEQDVLHQLLWFAESGEDPGGDLVRFQASVPVRLSVCADFLSERNGFKGHRNGKTRDSVDGDSVVVESIVPTSPLQSAIILENRARKIRDALDGDSVVEESIVPTSPLQSAIILKNRPLLDEFCSRNASELRCGNEKPFSWLLKGSDNGRDVKVELDTMELATLMGDQRVVGRLLENGYQRTLKRFTKQDYPGEISTWYHPWPAMHLAAHSGCYEMLKMFLDDPLCHHFIEDYEGNTGLHHALKVTKLDFNTHLLDYVSCRHILNTRKGNKNGFEHYANIERQSCINLLIQAGHDLFKSNKHNQVPYPRSSLSTNNEFLSWWNDKQTKEFSDRQNSLNNAATAISVTAALVATASFIGPLQPPLGYSEGSNRIQDDNRWVRVFIFCNTMSFYLGIASITFSLIPCLPIPQQAVMDELRRTRRMVTLAVAVLFPSTICVLVAFGVSSIAVVSSSPLSAGQILTIASTTLCAPFFLGGFFLFLIRLLGISFPANAYIRYIFNATSF